MEASVVTMLRMLAVVLMLTVRSHAIIQIFRLTHASALPLR